ncbi:MAG: signal peptide peptidase SppA [Saprospiraceae bacterium]|nr:signal peptide peptidase SppA [Saprospiraceae bacterium]
MRIGQFLQFTLASCLGVFIAFGLLIGGIVLYATAMMSRPAPSVPAGAVLRIDLKYTPPEQTNNTLQMPWAYNTSQILGLHDLIDCIEAAATDDRIDGIYLDPTYFYAGPASTELLHDALLAFRDQGKFVVAYGDYYSQGGYHLASAADHLVLNPVGGIELTGFSAMVPFYKNVLDKTGLEVQVYYAGDFKSATERYRRTEMSPESKLQTREYLDHTFSRFVEDIAAARDLSVDRLLEITAGLEAGSSDDVLRLGLVDEVGYQSDVNAWMRQQPGFDDQNEPEWIDVAEYASASRKSAATSDRIAVVYLAGEIVHGEGYSGSIGGKRYAEVLRKVRESDRIDAVVLRVNSPGGNILAADRILHEIKLLKETDKPVVVSMGDYAASGGYYISAYADSIFAEPSTLTGSIGVYTIIPNPHALLTDKLGITFDTVRTTRNSAAFSPYFPWSEAEHAWMQARTDAYYERFLDEVATGRGMERDAVHAIAQGRIWTGPQAVANGLVDKIGDLDAAISSAARLAGLESWRVSTYPKLEDPFNQMLKDLSNFNPSFISEQTLDAAVQRYFPKSAGLLDALTSGEPQARLPVLLPW